MQRLAAFFKKDTSHDYSELNDKQDSAEVVVQLESLQELSFRTLSPVPPPPTPPKKKSFQDFFNSEKSHQAWRRAKYMFQQSLLGVGEGAVGGLIVGIFIGAATKEDKQVELFCNYMKNYCSSFNCSFISCDTDAGSYEDALVLNCTFGNQSSTDYDSYPSQLKNDAEDSTEPGSAYSALIAWGVTTAAGAALGGVIRGGMAFFKQLPPEEKPTPPPPETKSDLRI